MEFVSECTLHCNKALDVQLPDMTDRYMVPYNITIVQINGQGEKQTETNARNIACRVSTSLEILNLNEPFFQINNIIDLSDNWANVKAFGRVKLNLTSKTKEIRRFKIYSKYRSSIGGVIYEDKIDKFDTILQTISERGRCSKIVITCSNPLKTLDFVTNVSCIEGSWIESFSANTDPDPNAIYTFDFTTGDLKEYVDSLKYMQLQITSQASADTTVYVTAYGFPRN